LEAGIIIRDCFLMIEQFCFKIKIIATGNKKFYSENKIQILLLFFLLIKNKVILEKTIKMSVQVIILCWPPNFTKIFLYDSFNTHFISKALTPPQIKDYKP